MLAGKHKKESGMSTNQARSPRGALEAKLNAVYDSTPEDLKEILDSMFSNARSVCDRAVAIADTLGHPIVDNVHLLLGVLALGNQDGTLAVPRKLREFGFDYQTLYDFLRERDDLRGTLRTARLPAYGEKVVPTLNRAREIAEQRGNSPHVIITADLVVALMEGSRTDEDLKQAFTQMGIARLELLTLRDVIGGPELERIRHLHVVDAVD